MNAVSIPRYDQQNPLTGVPTSPEEVKHPDCLECDHGTLIHGVGGCWACDCQMCWWYGQLKVLARREEP